MSEPRVGRSSPEALDNQEAKPEAREHPRLWRPRFDGAADYTDRPRPPSETRNARRELPAASERGTGQPSRFAEAADYCEPRQIESDATDTRVIEWRPDRCTVQEISWRVENDWVGGGTRPTEGKGVEAACQYLRDHERVTAIVASRSGGGGDILALDREGQLIVAEAKCTEVGAELQGTTACDGITPAGRLASRWTGKFELSPGWLSMHKGKMENDVRRRLEGLAPEERGPYQELLDRLHSTRFNHLATYRRMVFYVGRDLKLGALAEYDKVVKPERYVLVRT